MISDTIELLSGRAFTPDPFNENESLQLRFSKRPLIVLHFTGAGIEAAVIRFQNKANPTFENSETLPLTGDSEVTVRAIGEFASKHSASHVIALYSSMQTGGGKRPGVTESTRIKLKETPALNIKAYHTHPEQLLGEPKIPEMEHVVCLHPEFKSGLKFDISATHIRQLEDLISRAGLGIIRARFGLADLLNSFLDHNFDLVGEGIIFFYASDSSFFHCRIDRQKLADASYRGGLISDNAEPLIRERLVELKSMGQAIAIINDSRFDLEDSAVNISSHLPGDIIPFPGVQHPLLLAAVSSLENEYSIRPSIRYAHDLLPPRSYKQHAPPSLHALRLIFFLVLTAALVSVVSNKIRIKNLMHRSEAIATRTLVVNSENELVAVRRNTAEKQMITAYCLRRWLQISPPMQTLWTTLTPALNNTGLRSASIDFAPGLPQMRLVASTAGTDDKTASNAFASVERTLADRRFKSIQSTSIPISGGFNYDGIFNFPTP